MKPIQPLLFPESVQRSLRELPVIGEQKDLMLEPYDIVEVGKSKKSFGDILLEALTGLPNRIPIPIL